MGAAKYGMTADGYGWPGFWPAAGPPAQIGPENSAGCGSGSMFESECHALLWSHTLVVPGTCTKHTY
jgi:hypothetical protein